MNAKKEDPENGPAFFSKQDMLERERENETKKKGKNKSKRSVTAPSSSETKMVFDSQKAAVVGVIATSIAVADVEKAKIDSASSAISSSTSSSRSIVGCNGDIQSSSQDPLTSRIDPDRSSSIPAVPKASVSDPVEGDGALVYVY